METKALYKTESHRLLADLLDDTSGVIMRVRLPNGVGVAYAGEVEAGLLTLSRLEVSRPVTDDEAEHICKAFKVAAADLGKPVLLFKFLIREVVELGNGRFGKLKARRFAVVRYAVYFGEQGTIFNGEW